MKGIQDEVRNTGVIHREEVVELASPVLVPAAERARRFVELEIECCWTVGERGGVNTIRDVIRAVEERCLAEIGTRPSG
jgi:hypothetical protein